MQDEQDFIPDSLRHKFPKLRRIKGSPSLFTFNGIGVRFYGHRDQDDETGTYVKTRCFCILYLPLLALDAFRVADAAGGGWMIIGKEPLSHFARSWNIAMACLALWGGMMLGWNAHTSSPEYRARQEMVQARKLMESGHSLQAAGIYNQQLHGPLSAEALDGLTNALDRCLESAAPKTVAGALNLLYASSEARALLPEAPRRGLELVGKFRPQNPEGALDILNQVAQLDTNLNSVASLHVDLLKEVIQAQPDNTNRVVELALLYEADGKKDECIKLLMPRRDHLGNTEGARILGQHLLAEGMSDEAYSLLFPYVQTRLGKVRAIEANYTNTLARISDRSLNDLRKGRAPQSFYSAYESASESKKGDLVDEYIQQQMSNDPAYRRLLASLKEANEIVPVALDLGIVQLGRAQELQDPAERKKELEAAEKTFLAIRGFAGESDEYRLFLGQVYYWLGRAPEGKQLFDELLANRKRAYPILMSLANTLRNVGETSEARKLAEEAYQKAKDDPQRYAAVMFRALAFKDNEDRIAWLAKGNPDDTHTQIELNYARSIQALEKGDKENAARLARATIAGYQKQVRNAATLNNEALAYALLYNATGNPDDQKQYMRLQEDAVSLSPSDSILLINVTHSLIGQAVNDLLRDHLHPTVLGEGLDLDDLSYLYLNEQQQQQVLQLLRENENFRKGLAYLDKAMTLSPKNVGLYSLALSIQGNFRDAPELQKIVQRVHTTPLDLDAIRSATMERYTGAKDKEALQRYEGKMRKLQDYLKDPSILAVGETADYLNTALLENRQNARVYGVTVNSDELLQRATATYQRHQTYATRSGLLSALFFHANEEITKGSPEFAALAKHTRKSLSPAILLTAVLEQGGPLAEAALKNPSLQQALALNKESLASNPSRVSAFDWAMYRHADPATAAKLAEQIKSNQAVHLMDELSYEINPVSGGVVLAHYWLLKLDGKEKAAQEVYQTALRDRVPLPPL
jgi:tetratricopeptide (TPR) repeat protein